jgi:hypothetical protein
VVKKRTAPRAASRKSVKKAVKKTVKKAVKKKTAAKSRAVVPGAAYHTGKGVDLRPLKKAIRLSIERLSLVKESPKAASAIEGLVALQQRLTADCEPTMTFPTS